MPFFKGVHFKNSELEEDANFLKEQGLNEGQLNAILNYYLDRMIQRNHQEWFHASVFIGVFFILFSLAAHYFG